MASTPTRLAGPALVTNSAATKYTAPAGGALVRAIHVSNPTASAVDFTLSIGSDAAGTRLYDGYSIGIDTAITFWCYHALTSGEIVQAFAGTNNVITLTLDGDVFS
jgi:hypothetical protein